MCSSASGANPKHSLELAITPATNVPWPRPKQEYLLLILKLKLLIWGFVSTKV
jgi:hypothetical protein